MLDFFQMEEMVQEGWDLLNRSESMLMPFLPRFFR